MLAKRQLYVFFFFSPVPFFQYLSNPYMLSFFPLLTEGLMQTSAEELTSFMTLPTSYEGVENAVPTSDNEKAKSILLEFPSLIGSKQGKVSSGEEMIF